LATIAIKGKDYHEGREEKKKNTKKNGQASSLPVFLRVLLFFFASFV